MLICCGAFITRLHSPTLAYTSIFSVVFERYFFESYATSVLMSQKTTPYLTLEVVVAFDARRAKALEPGAHMIIEEAPGLRLVATATRKTWTYR